MEALPKLAEEDRLLELAVSRLAPNTLRQSGDFLIEQVVAPDE